MKRQYFILLLSLLLPLGLAAQIGINDTGNAPDSSAMLDISSTDKGILMPRMNTLQRDAIRNPVPGLMIYNVEDSCFNYYTGENWIRDCGADQVKIPVPVSSTGGTRFIEVNSIDTDAAGNSYLTGSFERTATFGDSVLTSYGEKDLFIAKYDSIGRPLWALQGGSGFDDIGWDIAVDDAGNSFITGTVSSNVRLADTLLIGPIRTVRTLVAKFDPNGRLVWVQEILGTSITWGPGISLDAMGNSYISGHFRGTTTFGGTSLSAASGSNDIFVTKINPTGQFVWAIQAGGSGEDVAWDITTDAAGNSHITGSFSNSANFGSTTLNSTRLNDVYVAKLDPTGQFDWAVGAGSLGAERGQDIAIDDMGNVYVAGNFNGFLDFGGTILLHERAGDVFVAKYNPNGKFLWAKSGPGQGEDNGLGIVADDDGNSYVIGYFRQSITFGNFTLNHPEPSNPFGNSYAFVVKYDPTGEVLWAKSVESSREASGSAIALHPSGRLHLSGTFRRTATFGTQTLESGSDTHIFLWLMNSADGSSSTYAGQTLNELQDGDTNPENELQNLSFSGTRLSLSKGNNVDLASLDTDTDDQTLSLSGTQLTIADGNTVDLDSIDTDDQTLSLTGTQLTIVDGNMVDLASIDTDTDDQTLSLTGTQLTIVDGNMVDLASIDTDDQTLSFSGTKLSIADGNIVDLDTLMDNLGDHTATQNLQLGDKWFTRNGVDSLGFQIGGQGQFNLYSASTLIMQLTNNNTPMIRLRQTNKTGFQAQTWDMGGNEREFFVRDITNGTKAPLRIKTGAENNRITINGSNVGIGLGTSNSIIPNATQALDVGGQIRMRGGAANGYIPVSDADGVMTWTDPITLPMGYLATQNVQMSGYWLSQDGDNEGVFVDANGNVGIGTDAPSEKLEIEGNARLDTDNAKLVFTSGSSSVGLRNTSEIRTNVDPPNTAGTPDPADNHMAFRVASNDNGGSAEVMRLLGDGKVGIGTATPSSLLQLEDTNPKLRLVDERVQASGTGNTMGTLEWLTRDGSHTSGFTKTGKIELVNTNNSATPDARMDFVVWEDDATGRFKRTPLSLWPNGNIAVGDGTSTPNKAKLEIFGSGSSYTVSGSSRYLGRGGDNINTNYSGTFSLYADGVIGAAAFVAHSDARIKDIQGLSESETDLATLMKIEITDYTLRDTIAKGHTPYKKVIAQQVAEVYPQAVTNSLTEVIPDIYQRAEVQEGWIMLATDLKVGERVKLITEQRSEVHEVLAVEADRFQVSSLKTANRELLSEAKSRKAGKTVFVYGREVTDFHTVDYEAISMLNVSATQEQQKIIEQQQILIEQLLLEKASQQKQITKLNTQLQKQQASFEARLQALEASVTP
ncbi:MAG: tail fiber domain-containing protein [Bacteroidota bacterium]